MSDENGTKAVAVKEDGRWVKKQPIESLYDLIGLDDEVARQVCVEMGVEFVPLPDVDIGNMTLDNLHINYTESIEFEIKREDGGVNFPIMLTAKGLQEAKLNDTLRIKAFNREESLRRYADSVRKEYEALSDEKLKDYDCLGNKRFARSQDEMLRRGLISKEQRAEQLRRIREREA